jgi:hypothetical protein
MRSPHSLVAVLLIGAASLCGCNCFVPVTEKQCDNQTPCGSNWRCLNGVCFPPEGAGGGAGGGSAGGVGGGGVGGGGVGGGGGVCGGCRDTANQCQPGNTLARCGANGSTCKACPSNQACQNGSCVSLQCNAANCPAGCCRAGVCIPLSMQTEASCGNSGMTCGGCGPGEVCSSGKCLLVSQCGSCAGCCLGTSICLPPANQSVANCGSNGKTCGMCGSGQVCLNGTCAPPPCSATTCANGCCDNGKCVPVSAQTAAACGTSGQVCQQCTAPTNTCKLGVCASPTCTGCLGPNGCSQGTSGFACGMNGASCIACGVGFACVNQACVSTRKIGDACLNNPECAGLGAGAVCKKATSSNNATYTNGFCTRPCGAAAPCTADSVCLNGVLQPFGESQIFCSPRCNNMQPCRSPGYACYFFSGIAASTCWVSPFPLIPSDGGVAFDGGVSPN